MTASNAGNRARACGRASGEGARARAVPLNPGPAAGPASAVHSPEPAPIVRGREHAARFIRIPYRPPSGRTVVAKNRIHYLCFRGPVAAKGRPSHGGCSTFGKMKADCSPSARKHRKSSASARCAPQPCRVLLCGLEDSIILRRHTHSRCCCRLLLLWPRIVSRPLSRGPGITHFW